MRHAFRGLRGLVAASLVLGFVAEVDAAGPHGIVAQRRGRGMVIPQKPVNVDSSETIDALNKALKALGATDREYDGHREKAITHIGTAIQHLELPNAKGKSNAAVEKAASGKAATATKTATTPDAASDESLRKAKTILFSVHHKLADHTATVGHKRADAQVRLAIDEIVAALNPAPAKLAAKAATAPLLSTPKAATSTATKPAK